MIRLFFTIVCAAGLCSKLQAQTHAWQLPLLESYEYRSAFTESEKDRAVFMLCNAPGRLRCEEAEQELLARMASDACKELFYIALVNGRGSGYGVLQQPFKVVFAVKKNGVFPILISYPDEDTTPINCHLISQVS